jgi:hypothetical protein
MAKMSQQELTSTVGIAILAAADVAGFYSAFCPSWFTVSSDFFSQQGSRAGNVRRIREGEAAATVLSLAVAAGASLAVQNPLPFWGALGICAVMIYGYERAMSHPASEES